uniref:JAB1/MPN/MOV34 metalloenzyme domain-containing protein n=1 Tax=Cercocebus atys TaxID=9531 RepID=A0A2K5M7J7_CERAT
MPELVKVQKVVVHPLVLLSVVDHFNQIGKAGNQKQVVGVLLGSWQKKVLDISNSVQFLLMKITKTILKVNARERIVLVIIDVNPKDLELPTEAYISVEEVHDDGTPTLKTFEHVTSEIGEVGVEHLLQDIKDTTVGTLSQRITNQVHGLKGLNSKLLDIRSYLEEVATGKLPIHHQIIYELQDVFSLLPDMSLQEPVKDQMVVVYLASLIHSVVALHNLINKIANQDGDKKERQEKEKSKKIEKLIRRKIKIRKRQDSVSKKKKKEDDNQLLLVVVLH